MICRNASSEAEMRGMTYRGNENYRKKYWPSPLKAKGDFGSGRLNPTWVEWLMGYPTEWTALEDSATLSCRKSRK
jgi:hypothetical protein